MLQMSCRYTNRGNTPLPSHLTGEQGALPHYLSQGFSWTAPHVPHWGIRFPFYSWISCQAVGALRYRFGREFVLQPSLPTEHNLPAARVGDADIPRVARLKSGQTGVG